MACWYETTLPRGLPKEPEKKVNSWGDLTTKRSKGRLWASETLNLKAGLRCPVDTRFPAILKGGMLEERMTSVHPCYHLAFLRNLPLTTGPSLDSLVRHPTQGKLTLAHEADPHQPVFGKPIALV